jgi:hypothetical protein
MLSLDENDNDDTECNITNRVLYDTLYRYLVLFGVPSGFLTADPNLVSTAIAECLGLSQTNNTKKVRRVNTTCVDEYQRDSSLWSMSHGSHTVIKRYIYTYFQLKGFINLSI